MMVALPVNKRTSPTAVAGACNPNGKCGNGLEKLYPTCAVRYGYMHYIGEFRYGEGMLFGCGQKVVVQTNRGMELGEQVSLTCTGCEKSVSRQQMMRYVKESGPEYLRLKAGKILRPASEQDLAEEIKLNQEAARQLGRARELVAQQGMAMKLVTCEHLFGGERVIFHFMSEERVDFRELVRLFAHEFHTRIEMHQVGARDEARLVADYEICGRECCCKNFLKKLRPVAMRMAKLQKATLDPSKVSGRCGRLRCCLRYEQEGYEAMDKKLPRVGARIRATQGVGTVVGRQVLTQLLKLDLDSGDTETIVVEDVLERGLPRRERPSDPGEQRVERGRRETRSGGPANTTSPRPQRTPETRAEAPATGAQPDAAPKIDRIAPPRDRDTDATAMPDSASETKGGQSADPKRSTDAEQRPPDGGSRRGGRRRRGRRGRGRGPGPHGGEAPNPPPAP